MFVEPIKIIWKYKNNNRRIQYNTYIYIGKVSKEIKNALNKIKDWSLYETFIKLTNQEYKILEKAYGEFWYKSFFNTYHINNTLINIRDNKIQNKEISDKYGKQWLEKNIIYGEIVEKKIFYSYESLVKTEQNRKLNKRERQIETGETEDEESDFRTVKLIKKIMKKSKPKQQGGAFFEEDEFERELIRRRINREEEYYEEQQPSQDAYMEEEEEYDIQDIENLYKMPDVNIDKNINKTSELIEKALNDKKIYDNKNNLIVDFDIREDDSIHDMNLRDAYEKHYVKSQFILKDDTIKTIKQKICCSLKNNKKFEKNARLIPSRIYLWSEYIQNKKIEKVSIGQKWVRKNELLNIDIEPNNNIRIYEELEGTLKSLRDSLKRYGNRIVREDDDNKLIYDYDNFYTNNEFYMIDIYNELGKNYSPSKDTLNNLLDVYMHLYFPKIKVEDMRYLIDYLNNDTRYESNRNNEIFDTMYNDLLIENEIIDTVEKVKANDYDKYKNIFKDNYITQSFIHLYIRSKTNSKLDLFRIFNEFVPNEKYPFIEYQTSDGQVVFKYNEVEIGKILKSKENTELLSKWFETSPYGISFKVKVTEKNIDKFMVINLNDQGRIEYKNQWKEIDRAVIDDIKYTYHYVRELISILNKDNNHFDAHTPEDEEFQFAFINTIQKFELPDKYPINHNDLSEFARYFYPYITIQIEPRKRTSKEQKQDEKSKFGTYLRYKRVSGYDNTTRIEQRIFYIIRNYEFTESQLVNEISKQFNITEERAVFEIDKVRTNYPNIKKSRKVLKKLETLPKYKAPGIGIDIQGKQVENYKIKIDGARDKYQLNRILSFMNVLIYLYIDTYLYKNPQRRVILEKLKNLDNIAKRRGLVDVIVNYAKSDIEIKQIISIDKQRLGFKPTKDQNQWTRCCQNSGKDKRRRPQPYNTANMDELIKDGYKLNEKTGEWEKKIIKNKQEIVLKTLKLDEYDEDGNKTGNEIHYGCTPEKNGKHMYVGFLTKCINPFGHCMPCCFKKDIMSSDNKKKIQFYKKCTGEKQSTEEPKEITRMEKNQILLDKLYILQDTNKIQVGRLGSLSKYLDFYFNKLLNKDIVIKQNYLSLSKKGYMFKYGVEQTGNAFMNSISLLLDMSVDEIYEKLINALENDKHDIIFTSLNNGEIRNEYITREKYIEYIKYGEFSYEYINNLLCVPSVLTSGGLNIIMFRKHTTSIKKELEKEKTKEDFYMDCQNSENKFNIIDKNRETIFILNEESNYYPIVMVYKLDENNKNFLLKKKFNYEPSEENNIITYILDYYYRNCHNNFTEDIINKNTTSNSVETYYELLKLNNKLLMPRFQFIDVRNKCKYFILNNNYILPVKLSGSLYNIPIIKNIEKNYRDFESTYEFLLNISKETNLRVKPTGVYYETKTKNDIRIIAITTEVDDIIPVIIQEIDIDKIKKLHLKIENKPLYDKLDRELEKESRDMIIDERIQDVNYDKYITESYELFRLELSKYLSENKEIKQDLLKIINPKMNPMAKSQDKQEYVKLFLYKLIDNKLFEKYNSLIKDELTGGTNKFIQIIDKIPNLNNYKIHNERDTCDVHTNKNECNENSHCVYSSGRCFMGLTRENIIMFINKITNELVDYDLKAFEILQIGDYFVSDIVDYTSYKERDGQKIIKSNSSVINKTLNELFGKNTNFKIGRRASKIKEIDYKQLNEAHPPKYQENTIVQEIMPNNITLFRAYVNSYYWIKNTYYDNNTRNIGFYHPIQTDFANYFRSVVIDWLQNNNNFTEIKEKLYKYMDVRKNIYETINNFIIKIGNDMQISTSCLVELYILNKIEKIPIYVYDTDDNLIYAIDDDIKYNYFTNKNKPNISPSKDDIVLRFRYSFNTDVPDKIDSIYYI